MLYEQNPYFSVWGLSNYTIGVAFILLNLINLLPVYPLDGGQLLNRVFLDEDSWVSKLFVLLSVAFMTWFALFGTSRPFYPLLLFPLMMILRMFGDSKLKQVEKKVEEESFDLDKSYSDLTNEEYWKIRTVVVTQHPSFRDVHEGPPYNYDEKEERIMSMIESLLHRHLIQDMTLVGKLLIILLWLFSFAVPWLLGIYQSILARFGI
jgi:Zn-dependent protease